MRLRRAEGRGREARAAEFVVEIGAGECIEPGAAGTGEAASIAGAAGGAGGYGFGFVL